MQLAEGSEGLEEVASALEMVILEEVTALREAKKNGMALSPAIIASGYLNPNYGGGQELDPEAHITALACMMGITLHWLACQESQ